MNKIEDKKIENLKRQIEKHNIVWDLHWLGVLEGKIVELRKEYKRLCKAKEVAVKTEGRTKALLGELIFERYNIPQNAELRNSKLKRFSGIMKDATQELITVIYDELGRLEEAQEACLKKIEEDKPIHSKLSEQLREIRAKA